MLSNRRTVRLDVFADVACPWCFIAKRRLDRVLAVQPEGSVQVRRRAYQLGPTLPREGVDARTFFLRKFGGEQQMRRAFAQVTAIGADEGIAFDFDRMRRAPNTLLAHQAIVMARGLGCQEQMVDALFRGHFEQGVDVGDLEQVLDLVERHKVGLHRATLGVMLEHDAALPVVRCDLDAAARHGVSGVPFFVAEGGLVLTGAQPSHTLERFLDAARQGRRPAEATAGKPAATSQGEHSRPTPTRATLAPPGPARTDQSEADLARTWRLTGR
ncbi:MAG: disulfide bond formation protein DsbA [Nitriliruptorales bacterium]|nr:disulfide bond formation protein DsbA [Nitriliruptorales bacterium]